MNPGRGAAEGRGVSTTHPSKDTTMTVPVHTSTTSSTSTRPGPPAGDLRRPGRARRAALLVAGVVGCLLPTVWTVNFIRMLATGELADHRFHQLTGQGLLLTSLWLGALVPMLVAGWRGRRPSTAPAVLHLSFVVVGTACALAAPQGGARELMALIGATGTLVWLALPRRARLRGPVDVSPLSLAPALLASAVVTPYALDQIALQHVATGLHAADPHFFDMAWMTLVLAVVGLLGALLRRARVLLAVSGAGLAATGIAMLALGEPTTTGTLFTGAGLLLAAAWALTSRREVVAIRHGAGVR
jgi:hypothetical protein